MLPFMLGNKSNVTLWKQCHFEAEAMYIMYNLELSTDKEPHHFTIHYNNVIDGATLKVEKYSKTRNVK